MRLLSVDTLTFVEFLSPNIPPYVITSHRWRLGEEVVLADFPQACETDSYGCNKVKAFAKYIKVNIPHIRWMWMDSCCIDQKSSQELSESINTMFRWYQDAEVCLAWLEDVFSTANAPSPLDSSIWFRRGWTLQELLAPRLVIFLAQDWQIIGHKGSPRHDRGQTSIEKGSNLNARIASITQIPEPILRDYNESRSLSTEEKLQWMRDRRTTREEDSSYCLLGIIGVSMNIRYGDGHERTRARLLAKASKMTTATNPERPSKAASNVPFRRDPNFLDRTGLTREIETKFAGPGRRVAIVGLGGVGKSQLAIEYARKLRQRSPETWVFWIHASNASRFEQSIRDVAEMLKIEPFPDGHLDVLKKVKNRLRDEENGKWLMILDNADDVQFLLEAPDQQLPATRTIDFIPPCEHGSLLITSRSRTEALKLAFEDEIIPVLPMSVDQAETLLVSKIGHSDPSNRRLAQALDCMPLAMSQAAAFIRERRPRYSVKQYCEYLEKSRESRTTMLRRKISLPNRDAEASNSVLLTWQISFEHVERLRPSAANLLSLMSCCDRLAIPEVLLQAPTAATKDLFDFEDDIALLDSFCFISTAADSSTWEMHRLVQDSTQLWLAMHNRLDTVYDEFIHRLWTAMPTGEFQNWPLCRSLFPHAKKVAGDQPKNHAALCEWSEVLFRAAWFALEQGNFAIANEVANSALEVAYRQFGNDDKRTLRYMNIAARAQSTMGHYAEAEQLLLKAVDIWRTIDLEDKSDMLVAMSNLAQVFEDQGRYSEAEQLNLEVIQMRRQTYGDEHPHTLASMENLASTYWAQDRNAEAETLYKKLFELRRRTLGEEHPRTLLLHEGLADSLFEQGRLDEAEEIYLNVLEIARRVLGDQHPNTLCTMQGLADTYLEQGRYAESEGLLQEVSRKRNQIMGPDHPSTLSNMFSLAETYYAQGRLDEAESISAQNVERSRKTLCEEHPDTVHRTEQLEKIRAARKDGPDVSIKRPAAADSSRGSDLKRRRLSRP